MWFFKSKKETKAGDTGASAAAPADIGSSSSISSGSSSASAASTSQTASAAASASSVQHEEAFVYATRKEALDMCSREVVAMLKCVEQQQWAWHWRCLDHQAALQRCYLQHQEPPAWSQTPLWKAVTKTVLDARAWLGTGPEAAAAAAAAAAAGTAAAAPPAAAQRGEGQQGTGRPLDQR